MSIGSQSISSITKSAFDYKSRKSQVLSSKDSVTSPTRPAREKQTIRSQHDKSLKSLKQQSPTHTVSSEPKSIQMRAIEGSPSNTVKSKDQKSPKELKALLKEKNK